MHTLTEAITEFMTQPLLMLQSVNQGLEAAINNYASAAITLASQPPSAFSINNSYVLFIASEGATDIYEGIDTLAKHMISKVKSKNSELQTIEVRACLCPMTFSYACVQFADVVNAADVCE